MKYIILDANPYTHDLETPVLFPEWLTHKNVAQAFPGVSVISAGFVKHAAHGVVCHGESTSLGLRPRMEDAELIEQCLNVPPPSAKPKAPHKFDILGLRTLP
jgi:hypothetical protein